MRITNKMMTNNMMNSINYNKNKVNNLENQYTSGKKIQKPSEDPIVAVRALKLRSNISELEQYKEKNIPDALSWMDVSESALNNINELVKKMNEYCVQGANDTLSVSARKSITENLQQIKDQIYQECNANYAGRYVFSGFKTNSGLVFEDDFSDLDYTITEKLPGSTILKTQTVTGQYALGDYDPVTSTEDDFKTAPQIKDDIYRIRLGYSKIDDDPIEISVNGNPLATDIKYMNSTDDGAYDPAPNQIIVVKDTGELIMDANNYEQLRTAPEDGIEITYHKTYFSAGDTKPEHYYDCVTTNEYGETKKYEKEVQDIMYEVNFSQSMKVNTQLSSYFGSEIARDVDELVSAVQDVENTQIKITEVEKYLQKPNITSSQKEALEQFKEQLSTELALKTTIMTDTFEQGIKKSNAYQTNVDIAISDLGSRYQRLELTQTRLTNQNVDFTELLSENEDADVVETYVGLTSAQTLYNAALNAASKVAKNSLLDFI